MLTNANAQPRRKPCIADTIKANVYADNSFKLFINSELVAVDCLRASQRGFRGRVAGLSNDGEATQAFVGNDANGDGSLSQSELNGRGGSRSAMSGFRKGHSKEIDRDGDGAITRAEAISNTERTFARMDRNGDDRITPAEMEAARRK